ncbi:zinc ribbon domain-containing protein [Alkalicoccobacillus gibsonii]|uniref:zinc ribbon domain-containing protein n=1 Tax=Alkalicoccobacillus gibsonii TaxID=79881 RepID=UPI001931AA02|nr:zinc ribbon domain-containing protein [Alkalicoccobacillus gibsonii]MBM0064913.1 zinc ribbon domain-containing protein [Alkalicoccobacillus gibsonii]
MELIILLIIIIIGGVILYFVDKYMMKKKREEESKQLIEEINQEIEVSDWKRPTGFIVMLLGIGVVVYSMIQANNMHDAVYFAEKELGLGSSIAQMEQLAICGGVLFVVGLVLFMASFVFTKTIPAISNVKFNHTIHQNVCSECNYATREEVKFCPNCGKENT